VTAPGADSAGQAADTAGQTGPGGPQQQPRGFPGRSELSLLMQHQLRIWLLVCVWM